MGDSYLKGQVIVVTGASRGIGLATAATLLRRGARVALIARNRTTLESAVAGLNSQHALAVSADVCDRGAVGAAMAQVAARYGRIDGLVNNVGFQFARRLEIMGEAEIRQLIDLNFVSAVFACQAVIPYLRAAGGGRIVNISSSTVRHENEFSHVGLYSASKAALEQAMADWLTKGPTFDGALQPQTLGEAIAACFEFPPGAAPEFVEVRPCVPTPKMLESEWKQDPA